MGGRSQSRRIREGKGVGKWVKGRGDGNKKDDNTGRAFVGGEGQPAGKTSEGEPSSDRKRKGLNIAKPVGQNMEIRTTVKPNCSKGELRLEKKHKGGIERTQGQTLEKKMSRDVKKVKRTEIDLFNGGAGGERKQDATRTRKVWGCGGEQGVGVGERGGPLTSIKSEVGPGIQGHGGQGRPK